MRLLELSQASVGGGRVGAIGDSLGGCFGVGLFGGNRCVFESGLLDARDCGRMLAICQIQMEWQNGLEIVRTYI